MTNEEGEIGFVTPYTPYEKPTVIKVKSKKLSFKDQKLALAAAEEERNKRRAAAAQQKARRHARDRNNSRCRKNCRRRR